VKAILSDKRANPPGDILDISLQRDSRVVKSVLSDDRVQVASANILQALILENRFSFQLLLLRRSVLTQVSSSDPDLKEPKATFNDLIARIQRLNTFRLKRLSKFVCGDVARLCLDFVPDLYCHGEPPFTTSPSGTKTLLFDTDSVSSL
jgi:hypothetical protein